MVLQRTCRPRIESSQAKQLRKRLSGGASGLGIVIVGLPTRQGVNPTSGLIFPNCNKKHLRVNILNGVGGDNGDEGSYRARMAMNVHMYLHNMFAIHIYIYIKLYPTKTSYSLHVSIFKPCLNDSPD